MFKKTTLLALALTATLLTTTLGFNTPIVEANTTTSITISNNTAGDIALTIGMNACVGDTWIGFGELSPGMSRTIEVQPGQTTVKVIRGSGASGAGICTDTTTVVDGFIVYQDIITLVDGQEALLDVSGVPVRNPAPVIDYNIVGDFALNAGEIGIFYPSFDGTNAFSRPTAHCFNGVSLSEVRIEENQTFAGQLGFIGVYDLNGISTNGDVRISYGISFMSEDTSCQMNSVYPTIYPFDISGIDMTNAANQPIITIEDISDINFAVQGFEFRVAYSSVDQTNPTIPVVPRLITVRTGGSDF